MLIPTCYNILLNESLRKQQQNPTKLQISQVGIYMRRNLSCNFFVCWYRHSFCGYRLSSIHRRCFDIWIFTDEGIVIYPIWKINTFLMPTLDGQASIIRPKSSTNFLHYVILAVKTSSEFSLFSLTRLVVSKKDTAVIATIRPKYQQYKTRDLR